MGTVRSHLPRHQGFGMPRNLPLRPRVTPLTLVVAASVALVLVVGVSVLLPDGGPRDDGALTPVTEQYAATTGAPARGSDHARGAGRDRPGAGRRPRPHPRAGHRRHAGGRAGALRGVRGPAVLPGSRLDRDPRGRAAGRRRHRHRGAPCRARPTGSTETTGDLADADLLAQRAAMAPAERADGRARGARGRRPLRRQGRAAAPPAARRAAARRLPRAAPGGPGVRHRGDRPPARRRGPSGCATTRSARP